MAEHDHTDTEPRGEVRQIAVGRSAESMDEALHDAAHVAQGIIKERGEARLVFDVVREQVVVSNPHVNEFRVILAESDASP